jgi:hypothetical protein
MIKDLIIPSKRNNYNPFFSTRVAMVILTLWVLLLNTFSGILIDNFGVYATNMTADRIIQLTNEERAKQGLGSVSSNALLSSAAHAKANDMFEKQYWDHFGPNGESPWDFIKAAGYNYVYAGENLGKGFTTSEGVHQAWMASPTHKENILSPNYQDIGIAIVSGELHGETLILVVQMFGSLSRPTVEESPLIGQSEPEPEVKKEVVEQKEPEYIQADSEDGKTKSIRIVYPEDEVTYTDPQLPIKGKTENFDIGEIIEIIKDNSVVGETKVEVDSVWEFQNSYDWAEGKNYLDAVISDGEKKYRDSVNFYIKSSPPEILGIDVQKTDGKFEISIDVDETAQEASLILGAQIIEGEIIDGVAKFTILEEDIEAKVFLVVTDEYGNFTEEDITKYFVEREERGNLSLAGFINFNISSVTRFITVLLATVILGILLIQIYFYNREYKLREKSGDFLMVGVWWFIFLFGSFIGYSGSIY